MSNIIAHAEDFQVKGTWKFFETAHGKDPVDGIGAEVKSRVRKSVLQVKSVVSNAQDFADVAEQECPKIKVVFVPEESINGLCGEKCLQRWEKCLTVPGARKVHSISRANNTNVFVAKNSQYKIQDEFPEKKETVIRQDYSSSSGNESSAVDETSDDNATSNGDDECDTDEDDGTAKENSHDDSRTNQGAQNVHIEHGLPSNLANHFKTSTTAKIPTYYEPLVSALLEEIVEFEDGMAILDKRDLFALYGHNKKPEDNCLTNFVIDTYLKLISSKILHWQSFGHQQFILSNEVLALWVLSLQLAKA